MELRRKDSSQIEIQAEMKSSPAGTGALGIFVLRGAVSGWTAFWELLHEVLPGTSPLPTAAPLQLVQALPAQGTGDWISPRKWNYYQGKDSRELWLKPASDLGSRPSFDFPAVKKLLYKDMDLGIRLLFHLIFILGLCFCDLLLPLLVHFFLQFFLFSKV